MSSSSVWTSSTVRARANHRAVVAISSATAFIGFMGVTAVNAAFAELGRSFPGAGVAELSWTVAAYGAALAAVMIPAGRVADVCGHRRVLATGVVLFVLSSAGCSVAASTVELVAARIVQGTAAGLMTPASFGLLLRETQEDDRPRAVAVWSAAAVASALLGPSLGGVVVDAAGWRTLFALNLPVGLVVLLGLAWLVPARRPDGGALPDGVGVALVVAAVALLVIGMTESGDWGWLDWRTLAAAVAGAGAMALALVRSARSHAPAVDLELMGDRTFLVANALSFVFAFAAFSWLLAAPLFAVNVWGYDALTAALSVAPCAVAATVTSLLAGRLPARGRAWSVVGGASLFAATAAALAATLGESPHVLSVWLPAGVLSGLALGLVLGSLSAAVAFSVPPKRIAGGAGMNMTARQLGGSLGVALLAALLGAGRAEAAGDFTVVWLAGAAASLVAAAGGLALLGSSERASRHG